MGDLEPVSGKDRGLVQRRGVSESEISDATLSGDDKAQGLALGSGG